MRIFFFFYERQINAPLVPFPCYVVYYGREIGFYSRVCEQPGASGSREHVSLPFLMQLKETYSHSSSTSHKTSRGGEEEVVVEGVNNPAQHLTS